MLLVLSFLTTTINAKSLPAFSISLSPTNDLSERLAADKDFQQFSFLIYEFTGKVQATKSGKLLINYFEYKNTTEEASILFSNLGFASSEKFNEYWKKIYQLKLNFQTKFPELISLNNPREILEVAAKKVAMNKVFSEISTLPTAICWAILAASLGACSIGVCNA